MSATQTFFGDNFIDNQEKQFDATSLEHKKLIGLYYSAHWCPPCRNFTPVLIDFYHQVKKLHPHDFEVIFLSCDQSLEQFNKERIQTDKRLMIGLGSWATTNFVVSGIGWATVPSGEAHYFHQMNVLWNTVNIGLAVPGYLKAKKALKSSPLPAFTPH